MEAGGGVTHPLSTPNPAGGAGRGFRYHAAMRIVSRIAAVALLFIACQAQAQGALEAARVAPYAATPAGVAVEMLKLAEVGASDYVIDLGSGDGRLVIAAAARFGARGGFGVDIDEKLVAYANASASQAGVADRVRFYARDLFATDVGEATVVTLYLFPAVMGRVAEKLKAELKPGTRIVSHDFALPGWAVERVVVVPAPEKNDTTGAQTATLYRYTAAPR